MKIGVIILLLISGLFLVSASTTIHMRKAMYFSKLADGSVRCELCPLRCRIAQGATGVCGARKNLDGELYSLVWGHPVAVHVDPIEKKPMFHFLPGSRILSLATAGCNLRCVFCQNWRISQARPEETRAMEMLPEEVVDMAVKMECPSIAFTYTEPTIFYEYMLDIAKAAHDRGIRTVWVSCGYINPEPLAELLPWLDGANIDLKGFDEDFYQKYTTGSLQPVLNTIEAVHKAGVVMEITNLVIPGANDSPEQIRNLCRWVKEHTAPDTPLHFSRFHPAYRLTDRPPTPPETLYRAVEIAREEGLSYVYTGNLPEDQEDTICPECGTVVIDRTGYRLVSSRLRHGKCEVCGHPVPGLFDREGE